MFILNEGSMLCRGTMEGRHVELKRQRGPESSVPENEELIVKHAGIGVHNYRMGMRRSLYDDAVSGDGELDPRVDPRPSFSAPFVPSFPLKTDTMAASPAPVSERTANLRINFPVPF